MRLLKILNLTEVTIDFVSCFQICFNLVFVLISYLFAHSTFFWANWSFQNIHNVYKDFEAITKQINSIYRPRSIQNGPVSYSSYEILIVDSSRCNIKPVHTGNHILKVGNCEESSFFRHKAAISNPLSVRTTFTLVYLV